MQPRELILSEKTGFRITNPAVPVIINDYRGIEFYNNSDLWKRTSFNLPPGKYYVVSGYFSKMQRPVDYALNPLPPRERYKKLPLDFDIKFTNNPYKASIHWNRKLITFDNSLKDKPLYILMFMLYHELAHHAYTNETFTDKLAENMMLQRGYNPSQTAKAAITSLSAKQYKRHFDAYKRNITYRS